ncbi:DNA-binding protein [Thiocapsa roseopersicina]|uniref:Replication region DNA-binding N-term n=1 Tax=Thiocapsa roseopersicina TaxID=1058 RepID=A0A1H3BL45_THIRO|nr:DNA-binding protein [Thiocapsa roseopersicina]SDX42617.1 replication region DNA-binding N-term [Thiocapsa roseopersicina]
MGRPGITSEQVHEAADALVADGVVPTVVGIRTRLGGGSPNNISKWGRPNSRITSRHFADGKPPGQGFRQKYLANSVVFRGGLNKISEVGCTPHHRVGSGRPEPAWGQTASDPDLPLGTSSCATVLDALETQVGFADSASLRQTSGLLRRRFWIRCAL